MKNPFDSPLFASGAKGSGDDKYDRESVVNAARAFARSSHKCVYVVDFYERSVLFVSSNVVRLVGKSAEALTGVGLGILLEYIPEMERATVVNQYRLAVEFFASVPLEDRAKYTVHCDFHLIKGDRCYLVHHTATSFHSSVGGHIEAVLCTIAPSSEREAGNFFILEEGGEWVYEYNVRRRSWERKKVIPLSDMEREVLCLSAQGHTMGEIASRVFRSLDTIKMRKKILFERFSVNSIVQAVAYAFNGRLF